MTARLGWVDMSAASIRDLIKAPAGSEIVGAEFHFPGVIRLLFSDDALPQVTGLIPTLQPFVGNKGWEWNVQPQPVHRFWCLWKGTFPPPTNGEEASPSFSLESWSSGKASVWQESLMADASVTSPAVGTTPGGDASVSGVFLAESSADAEKQARLAFTSGLVGVTFDGDPQVHDLNPPEDGVRSEALRSFDNHLRTHGCGEPEYGGFARCPVASALWTSIPKGERDAVEWQGGGPA